jgi:hypothetical protein
LQLIERAYKKNLLLLESPFPHHLNVMQKIRLYYAKLLIQADEMSKAKLLLLDNVRDFEAEMSIRSLRCYAIHAVEPKVIKSVRRSQS